jgi:DNA-binding transcriptional MerR regulator
MKATKEQQPVTLRTFTAGQAAKAAGIPYHLVDYWANTGLIVPSNVQASGSSSCRGYSFGDLVAMRVAGRLREAGFSSSKLRTVVHYLKRRGYENPLRDVYLLIVDGFDMAIVESHQLISVLKRQGQCYFLFALGEAVHDTERVAATLRPPKRGTARLVAVG